MKYKCGDKCRLFYNVLILYCTVCTHRFYIVQCVHIQLTLNISKISLTIEIFLYTSSFTYLWTLGLSIWFEQKYICLYQRKSCTTGIFMLIQRFESTEFKTMRGNSIYDIALCVHIDLILPCVYTLMVLFDVYTQILYCVVNTYMILYGVYTQIFTAVCII